MGPCVFMYGDNVEDYDLALEDVLSRMSEHLRGWTWDATQCADLVVIGQTDDGRYCILNDPSENAMEALAKEYDGRCPKKRQNMNKQRLNHVTVRNMLMPVRDSVILEASVHFVESAHGYCMLFPTNMCVALSEMYELIRTMMDLRMIKLKRSKNVAWMYHAFEQMPCFYYGDEAEEVFEDEE